MTYRESVLIWSGAKFDVFWIATNTAVSSPAWLDCLSVGTLTALLSGWFSAIQIPAPLFAFYFPLFMQDPSV